MILNVLLYNIYCIINLLLFDRLFKEFKEEIEKKIYILDLYTKFVLKNYKFYKKFYLNKDFFRKLYNYFRISLQNKYII